MRPSAATRARRIARALPAVLLASLALLTAAYAATGSLPFSLDGSRHDGMPQVTTSSLSGPIVRAAASQTLFRADNLQPGLTRIAQLTIANTGTTRGVFTFTPAALQDLPSGLPEPLSSVLQVTMLDATNRFSPVTLYQGAVAGLHALTLGTFAPGEAHVYRFVVSYPAGRADAQDNPLQGASTQVVFNWDAVFEDEVATPQTASAGAPATTAPDATVTPSSGKGTTPAVKRPVTLKLRWRPGTKATVVLATVRCARTCRGRLVATVGRPGSATRLRLTPVAVAVAGGHARTYVLSVPKAQLAGLTAAGAVRANVTLAVRTAAGRKRLTGRATLPAKR